MVIETKRLILRPFLKADGKMIGEIDAYPKAGEPHAGEDAVRDLPGVFENLQGLQAGIPGRLPGAEPGKVQDEEMLPVRRPYYLR